MKRFFDHSLDLARKAGILRARGTYVLCDEIDLCDVDFYARALPLLQFTLAELWDTRDRERNAITAAVVAQIGGIRGALTRHADRVIAGLFLMALLLLL